MGRITTDRPAHLTSVQVHKMVAARYGDAAITDAAALTIASWYQSPTGHGATFTELSTNGSVDYDDLRDAVHYERNARVDKSDAMILDMLGTWALNHPSRKD